MAPSRDLFQIKKTSDSLDNQKELSSDKLAIIAHSITTANSISGGDKNFIELAKIWRKRSRKITIITNRVGKKICLSHQLKAEFILLPDIEVNKFGTFLTFLYRLLTAAWVLKLVPKNSFRIVFSSSHYLTDILPAFFLKLKQKQLRWAIFINLYFPNPFRGYQFSYQQGWQFPKINESLNWISQFFSLLLAKGWADKIFCLNQQIKTLFLQKGFPQKKLLVFTYGVDRDLIRKITSAQRTTFTALFIGRLHPQKGLNDLVSIWAEVQRFFPRAKLGIIGSGPKPILEEFKKRIASQNLSQNILLLGFKDGKEKFKILSLAKILLFPSYYESFGNVILEAISCGKPVVSYDLPPVKSIFRKGVLFAPLGQTSLFARQVIRLVKNKIFYQKVANEAFRFSHKFSWRKTSQAIFSSLT